jgi:rubrerythrin
MPLEAQLNSALSAQTRSIDWSPFVIQQQPAKKKLGSPLHSQGIVDRIRAVAFAEKQALEGYRWAIREFCKDSQNETLRQAWTKIALDEERHLGLLTARLQDLARDGSQGLGGYFVPKLFESFLKCSTPHEFAFFMATAELRGQRAGEAFYLKLKEFDRITADLFALIASEEQQHIAVAQSLFGFSLEELQRL